jgi:DNA-binding transcriptional ArsR family regulator
VELQALAHPLRVRILDELREPASAAEVARRVGESRQNLNYHLKELERGGYARRVGERRAGSFVESLYQSSTSAVMVSAVGSWPVVDCDTTPASVRRRTSATPATWQGHVAAIYLASSADTAPEAVAEVRAVRGRGLEGDRYFTRAGTFSDHPGDGRDVTLIEREVVDALAAEAGIDLTGGEHRRNVVTCGVPLNHLVGSAFRVGRVVLRGTRLCEPCSHLARLTRPDVLPALVHRGGLRAEIVRGGTIRLADSIEP